MEKAVITASDLCIGYRQGKQEKRIHEHLFFRLYPGELTCLLGANGTGKSTLLRTLAASQPVVRLFRERTFTYHRRSTNRQDPGRRTDRI